LIGGSSPRSARMISMSAFDASAGIMIWIGSPESRTSAKTTTDTTNIDTIVWITRPMMKRCMRLSSRGTRRTRRVSAGSAPAPQLPGREAGPFDERRELGPDDARVDFGRAGERRQAAVGARDDVLASDHPREPADAIGHQLRMTVDGGRLPDRARYL